jgi:hypothetical protein
MDWGCEQSGVCRVGVVEVLVEVVVVVRLCNIFLITASE